LSWRCIHPDDDMMTVCPQLHEHSTHPWKDAPGQLQHEIMDIFIIQMLLECDCEHPRDEKGTLGLVGLLATRVTL